MCASESYLGELGTKKGNRSFKITAVERKRLEGRDKVFLFY